MSVKASDICQRTRSNHSKTDPSIIRYLFIIPIEKLDNEHKIYAKRFDAFKYHLMATCAITNYVHAVSVTSNTVQVIAKALIHRYMPLRLIKSLHSGQRLSITDERNHSAYSLCF